MLCKHSLIRTLCTTLLIVSAVLQMFRAHLKLPMWRSHLRQCCVTVYPAKPLCRLRRKLKSSKLSEHYGSTTSEFLLLPEFNISPDAEELMCPKMLLQPIIENTFKHGFVPRTKNAHIVISANVDTDRLIIILFDNGKRLSERNIIQVA